MVVGVGRFCWGGQEKFQCLAAHETCPSDQGGMLGNVLVAAVHSPTSSLLAAATCSSYSQQSWTGDVFEEKAV